MFSGTENRIFDCRRCKRNDDKRSAIWGLKPGVDVWKRIRGDVFTNEKPRDFSNPIKVFHEGWDGIVNSKLVSENDKPRSLWSAGNWHPETGKRSISAGICVQSRKEEVKSGTERKSSPLIAAQERARHAELQGEICESEEEKSRNFDKGTTARKGKWRSRESPLFSLADRCWSPKIREESLRDYRSRCFDRCKDPALPSRADRRRRSNDRRGEFDMSPRVERNDGRKQESNFLSREEGCRSNARKHESNFSSRVSRSSGSGTPKELRSASQTKNRRNTSCFRRNESQAAGRCDSRREDSIGRFWRSDMNSQPKRAGSVVRNTKHYWQSAVNGRTDRKLGATLQAERNTKEKNLKAEIHTSRNIAENITSSKGTMSTREENHRGRRPIPGRNRKGRSSEESYGVNVLRGRDRKSGATLQAERNTKEKNFQAGIHPTRNIAETSSRGTMSPREENHRGRRPIPGRNRQGDSSEESYGVNSLRGRGSAPGRNWTRGSSEESFVKSTDGGQNSVWRRNRKTPSSVESYDESESSRRREEEEICEQSTSGTTPDSRVSDEKSEVEGDWNPSSYRGSDDPHYEGVENLGRNMTSAQIWKLTKGSLQTRPRRGRKREDCRVCEDHEHRRKEIMEEAERVDKVQWTKKLLNRVDGIRNGVGNQKNRFPWSVHDDKIRESLKRIAAPRRVYGGWPGTHYKEEVQKADVRESTKFQHSHTQEKKKESRAPSSGREEYSDERLSSPESYRPRIGGNDPVTEIVIPDPRKTWNLRDEKRRDTGFKSPDRIRKKPQSSEQGMTANKVLMKTEKLSNLQEEVTDEHGMPADSESLRQRFLANLEREMKVAADHGVLPNQESLRKQLMASVEKEMSKTASLESREIPEDRHTARMLNDKEVRIQQSLPSIRECSESSASQKKDVPDRSNTRERHTPKPGINFKSRPISATGKRDPNPCDTRRIPDFSEDQEHKRNQAESTLFASRERDPTPGEAIDDGRRFNRSRRPTPWVGHPTVPLHWEREQDEQPTKDEDDESKITTKQQQEEEPENFPIPPPPVTTGTPASPLENKITSKRYYCPSTPRSSVNVHSSPCRRFMKKEEASKKRLLVQKEPREPKYSNEMLSTRSRLPPQTISPCQRFLGHEDKSSLFLHKKHEDEVKLEQEAKEWCSPKSIHVQSVMKRARDMRKTPFCQRFANHDEKSTAYLQIKHEQEYKLEQEARESRSPRDQHSQSVQKRAQDFPSPSCEKYKRREEKGTIPSERPIPRTAAAKNRHEHEHAPMRQEVESPRSCETSTRHHEESRKVFEKSESSRESTPGDRGFRDWKEEEETTRESSREAQGRKEVGRPCNRWQTHDEKSKMVLEQARIKLEETLMKHNDCPILHDKCQNCRDKRKEVDSLRRWREIKRDQDSNYSPYHKCN